MSGLLHKIAVHGAALMLSMGPAAAETLGVYQTTDRKMDYQLDTCGNGKDLCVTLLAARGSAASPGVLPYIGKLIVNQAKAAGKNRWKGRMRVGDYDLNGTLKLTPGVSFVMSGCVYIVACTDFTLIPAE